MIKNYLGKTISFDYDENYSLLVTYRLKNIDENKYIAFLILYDRDTDSSRTIKEKIKINSLTENQEVTPENIEDIITEYMKKLDGQHYFDKYIEQHKEDIRLLNLGVEFSDWMKHEEVDYHEWLEHHKIS